MSSKFKVGDWVEVRSKEEILRTLDSKAQLDGMPFMPEMLPFCGSKLQVYKSAHKTCEMINGRYVGRRLERTVHLDTRCDGQAHGGCQAGCQFFWKEAWLKPSGQPADDPTAPRETTSGAANSASAESLITLGAQVPDPKGGPPTYVCQATQLASATEQLAWWDIRQYIEDYSSGNVGLRRVATSLVYSAYYHLSTSRFRLGRPMEWLWDKCRGLWGGTLFPRKPGVLPLGTPTPVANLNLQPGELVRVKPHLEILKTVTTDNKNRGMHWDAELVPYCDGTYKVLKRVTKTINERTGKLEDMKTPCIILDSVLCQSRYSDCRMLCPRSTYPYWREIWLERVGTKNANAVSSEEANMAPTSAR